MIDKSLGNAIAGQMYHHWIGPELEARARVGTLPLDFQMKQCLIRLPSNSRPIVEFNEEVALKAKVKVADDCEPKVGDTARLDNIQYVERIYPPEIDGKRVAFIYARWVGGEYSVFFDLSPNHEDIPQQPGDEWDIGRAIGASVQSSMVELALDVHESVQAEVTKIGLWAAPALVPYPLSKIASLVKAGDEAGARKALVDHCSAPRLTDLVAGWWVVPAFSDRRPLIEQALGAHVAGQYFLSVSTLIPHLEGVMTDWLHTTISDAPFRQESKTKKFRDVIASWQDATPTFRRVAESAIGFILTGPALATFKNWSDSFDTSFANRNVVGHGKFDAKLYGEENSAKLFLMLDTLAQLISIYGMKPGPSVTSQP